MDNHMDREFKRSIEELYPRLHRAMRAYLAGSSVDAEDLLQETFLKAYLNLDTFREDASMYTWLYSIARNLAIDEFRKRKYEKLMSSTPIEELEVSYIDNSDGLENLDHQVLMMRKAIAQLPEILRSIVVMKTIDGLSYPEIAEITDLNEETIKNRMFRARKELAIMLKQMGIERS